MPSVALRDDFEMISPCFVNLFLFQWSIEPKVTDRAFAVGVAGANAQSVIIFKYSIFNLQ